ncbi:MAG: hypothetical protein A2252_03840 [Elusimicrobia bacterium RIFOXYA2_FULL_39_19]|nr:MAG: hypothetical protein A2252_03840 [Elusimicrobia bacterium RIFOXYA2_FULL_39_19]
MSTTKKPMNFETPEENIAFDEALLVQAEKNGTGEAVRFWESKKYFVVLGTGNKIHQEVDIEACAKDNVPVLRRTSAGGTVLQGPGCLNFSLVLSYERDKTLADVNKSYNYILEKIIDCAKIASGNGNICFKPISDIVYADKKVSGNAQARKRHFFLHHGTWLYDFDLKLISSYLKEPVNQPDYRRKRKHNDFVANVPLNIEKFKKEVFKKFDLPEITQNSPELAVQVSELIEKKYSLDSWNRKI